MIVPTQPSSKTISEAPRSPAADDNDWALAPSDRSQLKIAYSIVAKGLRTAHNPGPHEKSHPDSVPGCTHDTAGIPAVDEPWQRMA